MMDKDTQLRIMYAVWGGAAAFLILRSVVRALLRP